MSGGSYDYICFDVVRDLMDKQQQIQNMADRLARLGYAHDAAQETQELLLTIRQFENRIEAMQGRLVMLWKAVEWWDSGDISEDGVQRALARYRGINNIDREV